MIYNVMDHKTNFASGYEAITMPEVDYLVCGTCQQDFPLHDIVRFMQHKKFDCDDTRPAKRVEVVDTPSRRLLCKSCPRKFTTPWQLLQHAQRVHSLLIYMEDEVVDLQDDAMYVTMAERSIDTQHTGTDKLTEGTVTKIPQPSDTKTLISPIDAEYVTMLERGIETQHKSTEIQTEPSEDTITTQSSLEFKALISTLDQQHPPSSGSVLLDSNILSTDNRNDMAPESSQIGTRIDEMTSHQYSELPAIKVANVGSRIESDKTEQFFGDRRYFIDTEINKIQETNKSDDNQSKISDMKEQPSDGPGIKKEKLEETDENICCDDQECGITFMPVTHAIPEKCCVAVVPKKRKRHMQTKHMTVRRRLSRLRKSNDTNVIINFDPSTETSPNKQDDAKPTDTSSQSTSLALATSIIPQPTQEKQIQLSTKEKSVIIQPGTTFAVPVPLTMAKSMTVHQPYLGRSTEVNFVDKTDHSHGGGGPNVHLPLPSFQITAAGLVTQTPTLQGQRRIEGSRSLLEKPTPALAAVEISGVPYQAQTRGKKRKYPTSKPYKCDQCDQAFNQRIHLRKHQAKHTGVKPYQCHQCDYSTVEKSHLKVHIRVHTGEKPYKCTYCEYATAQNSTLKIHLKRHHMRPSDKKVECTLCELEFDNEDLLQIHRDEKHRASNSQSAPSLQNNQSSTTI